MSLAAAAADLIREIGSGTVNDILPEMEGCTRAQVVKALQNAAREGLIECDGRGAKKKGAGVGRGTQIPATYRAIRNAPVRRVSTVFELGARL